MDANCTDNVMEHVCNIFYKECVEVDDVESGERIWMPSLQCRGSCEGYLNVFNSCIAQMDENGRDSFETALFNLAQTGGAGVNGVLLGASPFPRGSDGTFKSYGLLPCDVPGHTTIDDGEGPLNFWD